MRIKIEFTERGTTGVYEAPSFNNLSELAEELTEKQFISFFTEEKEVLFATNTISAVWESEEDVTVTKGRMARR